MAETRPISWLCELLPTFESGIALPKTAVDVCRTLRRPEVEEILCLALGPEGTNIEAATQQWIAHMGIREKAH